jgi:Ion channel
MGEGSPTSSITATKEDGMMAAMSNRGPGPQDVTVDRLRHRPIRRLLSSLISPRSFGSVFVLILVTYVLTVSLHDEWARSLVLFVQIATVRLALRVSRARRPVRVVADVMLVLATLLAVANLAGVRGDGVTTVIFVTSSLLYFIAPLSILRHLLEGQEVDLEVVLGAVDAYLLIGMFFAFTYLALGAVQDPFFQTGVDSTPADAMFFSFTTLTTTGYGNLVPAANPGQSLAVLEMLIGQLFLISAVAKVINLWQPHVRRAQDAKRQDPAGSDPSTTDGDS